MKFLKLNNLIMLVAMMAIVGCTVTPQSSAQAIYQLQGNYNAAVSLENKYASLPTCGSINAPILCKNLKTAKLVRQIDDAAWEAISVAQATVRTSGFGEEKAATALATAKATVAAFSNIVLTLGVK